MQIRILGPIDVDPGGGGRPLEPTGAKQRMLLGALVVRMGQALPPERLIENLWGEGPPAKAANALQAHLTRLRRLLAATGCAPQPRIVTTPTGYGLHAGPEDTDAARFLRLSAEGRARIGDDPAAAADVLRHALSLWRGSALEGCDDDICRAEAMHLEESRLLAVEAMHDACLRAGRHEEIVGELEELTATHPARERLHDQLMVALYRCGRQTEALGTYERARSRLASELGVEPGPALRARMSEILQQSPTLAAPTRTRAVVTPLPLARGAGEAQSSPMGRLDDELAQLRRGLDVLSRRHRELTERFDRLAELADAR